ncbi:uncharacterized protein LOC132717433 [Ruditapes philippinarum]|uniref:uncharacterized protein LOC132717433 n=1 Tax=Ruditapes philippinarum TaxID=129788 RepID=UPI00295B09EC|nr:uncharacterized protein LOC132717433 [Ruditapes philippinarum]
MLRFEVCLLLVVAVVYTMANECSNCTCGQVCDSTSVCADGCLVYDKFIKVGEELAVYGNTCKCQTETDEKGRVIVCTSLEFVGAPAGDPWTLNPNCNTKP